MANLSMAGLKEHARAVSTGVQECTDTHDDAVTQISVATGTIVRVLRAQLKRDVAPVDLVTVQLQRYIQQTRDGYLYMESGARITTSIMGLERWQRYGNMLLCTNVYGGKNNDKVHVGTSRDYHNYHAESILRNSPGTITIGTFDIPKSQRLDNTFLAVARKYAAYQEFQVATSATRTMDDTVHAHRLLAADADALSKLAQFTGQFNMSERIRPTQPPAVVEAGAFVFP